MATKPGQNSGGNDFGKMPGGSAPGGSGADLLNNPKGQGPSGAAPRDFTQSGKGPQKQGEPEDMNPESITKEGNLRVPLAEVPSNSPRKPLIGVGSSGDGRKPFKGI